MMTLEPQCWLSPSHGRIVAASPPLGRCSRRCELGHPGRRWSIGPLDDLTLTAKASRTVPTTMSTMPKCWRVTSRLAGRPSTTSRSRAGPSPGRVPVDASGRRGRSVGTCRPARKRKAALASPSRATGRCDGRSTPPATSSCRPSSACTTARSERPSGECRRATRWTSWPDRLDR